MVCAVCLTMFLYDIVNIMAADGLLMSGVRKSAAMILT